MLDVLTEQFSISQQGFSQSWAFWAVVSIAGNVIQFLRSFKK